MTFASFAVFSLHSGFVWYQILVFPFPTDAAPQFLSKVTFYALKTASWSVSSHLRFCFVLFCWYLNFPNGELSLKLVCMAFVSLERNPWVRKRSSRFPFPTRLYNPDVPRVLHGYTISWFHRVIKIRVMRERMHLAFSINQFLYKV